jgi:Ankyrin repeat
MKQLVQGISQKSREWAPLRHQSQTRLSAINSSERLTSCSLSVSVYCRKWIDKGKAIDVRDHTQRTPLHYAAQWGQECILEYLIHCGADVNAQDFIMDTPLHFVSCLASYCRYQACYASVLCTMFAED